MSTREEDRMESLLIAILSHLVSPNFACLTRRSKGIRRYKMYGYRDQQAFHPVFLSGAHRYVVCEATSTRKTGWTVCVADATAPVEGTIVVLFLLLFNRRRAEKDEKYSTWK
jgi:hypothetical protein